MSPVEAGSIVERRRIFQVGFKDTPARDRSSIPPMIGPVTPWERQGTDLCLLMPILQYYCRYLLQLWIFRQGPGCEA
jgi:hypothetical protein